MIIGADGDDDTMMIVMLALWLLRNLPPVSQYPPVFSAPRT